MWLTTTELNIKFEAENRTGSLKKADNSWTSNGERRLPEPLKILPPIPAHHNGRGGCSPLCNPRCTWNPTSSLLNGQPQISWRRWPTSSILPNLLNNHRREHHQGKVAQRFLESNLPLIYFSHTYLALTPKRGVGYNRTVSPMQNASLPSLNISSNSIVEHEVINASFTYKKSMWHSKWILSGLSS